MPNILNPSYDDFNKLISENKLVLIDFWASWCAPCKMIAPIIEKIATEYSSKLTVAKVDIDENQKLAQELNIQSIPTVILFKDGKSVSRKIGAMSFEDYSAEIDKYI